MDPPFAGIVETTLDALILFENSRRGHLPRITRRLAEKERGMIKSGAVFIFDEGESGIKRWTDGLIWSPSRILSNFLVYRETTKRGDKSLATQPTSEASQEDPDSNLIPGSEDHAAMLSRKERERERERQLVGSLTTSYDFKKGGLVKKTISVSANGVAQHLVSYYSLEDAKSGRLRSPSTIPELVAFAISPDYLDPKHFRFPPQTEFGPDGILRYRAEAEEASNSPSSQPPKALLPAPQSATDSSSDRTRPSSRQSQSSGSAPGPSGWIRTSTAILKASSLSGRKPTSSSGSPNPDSTAPIPYSFETIPPNPHYNTSYSPPPIDHFPFYDQSRPQIISRTSTPGLISDLPPPPPYQQQTSQLSLGYAHLSDPSQFASTPSSAIPIPPQNTGRPPRSSSINPRPLSSGLRPPNRQQSPALGSQPSLHSPSLGGSSGRSSRGYHPYGNSASMGDASFEGVRRGSGSADGRSGHRQYSSANSFFPAPLSEGGTWNQPPSMLSSASSAPAEFSPSSQFPPMPYSFESSFNSYPSRVTADHLLAQAIRGEASSGRGRDSEPMSRGGSGGGGGIDSGPLASSDQHSYSNFPSHPSPPLAYPGEPYQQSPSLPPLNSTGSFENSTPFSRPRFSSSAGFPLGQSEAEFQRFLPTAPASLHPRRSSLAPHQQQMYSYPAAPLAPPPPSSFNEPYYPPCDYPTNPPPSHAYDPQPSATFYPQRHDSDTKFPFSQPSDQLPLDPYGSDSHQRITFPPSYPQNDYQHQHYQSIPPPPPASSSTPKLVEPSSSSGPTSMDFANFDPIAALNEHDADEDNRGEGGGTSLEELPGSTGGGSGPQNGQQPPRPEDWVPPSSSSERADEPFGWL